MNPQLLTGKPIAQLQSQALQRTIANLPCPPSLAIIQVGDVPASTIYVTRKQKSAQSLGITTQLIKLPVDVTAAQFKHEIQELNRRPDVHGILVQLPLPPHLDWTEIVEVIEPSKDVDGLSTHQQQLLASGQAQFIPATAKAVMSLLDYYQIDLKEKKIVIAGRSKLVGWPVEQLLIHRGFQPQVIHSQTPNIDDALKSADLIISATGQPGLLHSGNIKPGAVIIDVGITRTSNGIVGDAQQAELAEAGAVSAITPVPGGIGPLTITSLMQNVVQAASALQPADSNSPTTSPDRP